MDIKEEDILGERIADHWYYRAKGAALLDMLSNVSVNRVADIGAGSGYFSKLLLETGTANESICIDPAYERNTEQVVNGRPLKFRREPNFTCADLVLMMDVLEHVDDDSALLSQYSSILSSDGFLIVTVPAFNWLWSGHDEFLEHRRRYTRSNLIKVLENGGFEVLRSNYFYLSLLPLVIPMRVMDKLRVRFNQKEPASSLKLHSDWVNSTLTSILSIERKFLFNLNRVAGLSVFCLATKRR